MSLDPARVAAPLLLALIGCSSAETDRTPNPIQVEFQPSALTASFGHGDRIPVMYLDATLSRAPDGPVLVLVQQPEPVIVPADTAVYPSSTGTFATVVLRPSCALAPGNHAGTLTFTLCRDQGCGSTYALSGNALPYAFSVSEGLRVTAAVNGVPQPGYTTPCGVGGLGGGAVVGSSANFRMTGGQTLLVASTVPVKWSWSMSGYTCFPDVDLASIVETETTWTAIVRNTDAGASNVHCGYLDVRAAPLDNPYNFATATALVVSP